MKNIRVSKSFLLIMVVTSNAPIILYSLFDLFRRIGLSDLLSLPILIVLGMMAISMLIIAQIMPSIRKIEGSRRVKILVGGRRLILISYGIVIADVLLLVIGHSMVRQRFLNAQLLTLDIAETVNIVFAIVMSVVCYTNGYIRIVATSRRLGPLKRVMSLLFMYIPIVQLGLSIHLMKVARDEYDHECYKLNTDQIRVQSKVCKTKYPILMLHGVGFKDYKYLNYWGRIPNELIKNGATIYYGHQEAWGTIESNAQDVRNKIFEILENEKCEKVNIIAHSKGGLDARYTVSQLGMGDYVSTLTMIGSPHRGSEVLEFVYRLPQFIVRTVGDIINWHFRVIGDKNPDFHTASKQFLEEYSQRFNKEVVDHPQVYYQSYATEMKTPFSDLLLLIPYCIVALLGGKNDGLVTIESAKWGVFKGVIKNTYNRGISHGDIIDLKREDYRGFDVREFYVRMVSEIKAFEQ